MVNPATDPIVGPSSLREPASVFQYSFYHKDTGILHPRRLTASNPDIVRLNTPEDHSEIAGFHDHLCRRVDVSTGRVVDYQPPAPSDEHEWDDTIKRWKLKASVVAQRDALAAAHMRVLDIERRLIPRAVLMHALSGTAATQAALSDLQDELTKLDAQIKD